MASPLSEQDWQAVIKLLQDSTALWAFCRSGQRSIKNIDPTALLHKLEFESDSVLQRLDAAAVLPMPPSTWNQLVKKQVGVLAAGMCCPCTRCVVGQPGWGHLAVPLQGTAAAAAQGAPRSGWHCHWASGPLAAAGALAACGYGTQR